MDFNLTVPLEADNESPRELPPRPRSWRQFMTGWRRAALYLLIFITFLSLTLLTALLVSLFGLADSPGAVSDKNGASTSTLLFRGYCETSTQYNFWAHLLINFIASGVLASSNFFMQVIVAPTRADVDRAHAKGTALEIGVQSFTNLFHVATRNKIFWLLLCVSTIPLHLTFNSAILESRASTDFLLLMASEPFLTGSPWNGTVASGLQEDSKSPPRLREIQPSLSEDPSHWERMSIQDCFARYNDLTRSLTERRDVIMVLALDNPGSSNSTGTFGWSVNGSAENSLWYFRGYQRTDYVISEMHDRFLKNYKYTDQNFVLDEGRGPERNIRFDESTYTVRNNGSRYPPELESMKAEYCMSERWTAPCRVEVDNALLLTVVVICLVKTALCGMILFTARGPTPLITPGDAIESFITKPDPTTLGMCTFSSADFNQNQRQGGSRAGYRWLPAARPWNQTSSDTSRRGFFAVPDGIWYWSYFLIGGALVVGGTFLGISIREQSIYESSFGHSPANAQLKVSQSIDLNSATIPVLANTPQLLLSMCYFAYNGLFTRMISEREWSSFSTYRSLRVTHRKGQQRTTYRLQLPYRWSLPLLAVSALLHWLYSNSLYITIYEGHRWPSESINENRGLAYSSRSIVISFAISLAVALAPLILGYVKLPGNMPMAQNSSAVISAACHCVPTRSSHGTSTETLDKPLLQARSPRSLTESITEYKSKSSNKDALWDLATGKLKWGVVSPGREGEPGHLAFGGPNQEISEPVEECLYAGKKDI
ncbi:hypothetical protein B0T16DRAFT_127146 [Cercophora newfieldiana]|uniref:DUF6536 domain-containing protein n=1 Tax=Cercophora newfieldiana TaxID=92897 RepID=A0AA39YAU9_9PEZI|nr:hypothetical protein B0T16DRAFT_127146 [Cercophora newfieldiana]